MVQHRAARFVKNTPYRHSEQQTSITRVVEHLGWPLLAERRRKTRLHMFYKVINNLVEVPRSITQHRTAHSQVKEIKESSYAPSLKLIPSSIRSFLAPSPTGTTWTKTQLSKPLLNNSRSSSCTNLFTRNVNLFIPL